MAIVYKLCLRRKRPVSIDSIKMCSLPYPCEIIKIKKKIKKKAFFILFYSFNVFQVLFLEKYVDSSNMCSFPSLCISAVRLGTPENSAIQKLSIIIIIMIIIKCILLMFYVLFFQK